MSWNSRNMRVWKVVNNARYIEQSIEFMEKWVLRCSNPSTQISAATTSEHIQADVLIEDEIAALQAREHRAYLELLELSTVIDLLLSRKLAGLPGPPPHQTMWLSPFEPPLTLIRIWDDYPRAHMLKHLGFAVGTGGSVNQQTLPASYGQKVSLICGVFQTTVKEQSAIQTGSP